MKISMILDKIDEKHLFVPTFQREYVWKREDVKQLMDSLIKEYPTGTMLTWETNNPPDLTGIAHVAPDHDVHIALVAAGMQSVRRRGLGNGPERPGQRAADRKPTGQCQFRSVPGTGLPS
jgi:hypothetical protein